MAGIITVRDAFCVLGYLDATETAAPLKVFDTPVAWLQGNCDGAVFLDDVEARWSAERYAEDEAALADWWRAAS